SSSGALSTTSTVIAGWSPARMLRTHRARLLARPRVATTAVTGAADAGGRRTGRSGAVRSSVLIHAGPCTGWARTCTVGPSTSSSATDDPRSHAVHASASGVARRPHPGPALRPGLVPTQQRHAPDVAAQR